MSHHPGGSDNLFDPDRPLGTFSAKIALAYRLNLIDRDFEHALQMVRKIRNDFAHSVSKASLSESRHKSRVEELAKETKRAGKGFHSDIHELVAPDTGSKELGEFCAAVAVLLVCIEMAQEQNEPFKPAEVARLSRSNDAT